MLKKERGMAMAVDYTKAENYKHAAKRLGISLEEYLLMVMIEKMEELKLMVKYKP